MESSIFIAIITAITSIVVAVLQMTASLRIARLKELPVQPNVAPEQPTASMKTVTPYRTWFWIGSILVISNIIWLLWLGTEMATPVQFAGVLWCTCLLAYFRPIRWAYVAGVVTLINAISLFTSYLQIGPWNSEDIVFVSVFYVGNAILATGIAYISMRNSESR